MTNIRPDQVSNMVPPGRKPQSIRVSHQSRPSTMYPPNSGSMSDQRRNPLLVQCRSIIHEAGRGTRMIYSSSTFCPHQGRVIRDLFRQLHSVIVWYERTSLQPSSKGSCSLLVSGHNLWADCQWRTLFPLLNCGANAALASVLALV